MCLGGVWGVLEVVGSFDSCGPIHVIRVSCILGSSNVKAYLAERQAMRWPLAGELAPVTHVSIMAATQAAQ